MGLAFQLLPGKTGDTPGVLLFAVLGIVGRVSRFGKHLLSLLALVAAIILVVTQTELTGALSSPWIRCDQPPDSGVEAVVVLSASINPNGTMSGEALDHLITGLELTRSGAPLLVTTTVQQIFPTGQVSSEGDQARIVSLLGRDVRWLATPPGRSTREEAIRVDKLLRPRGINRIAVVASAMHTRRACSAFEAVGFLVTCVPALSRSPDGLTSGSWPRDRLLGFGEWVYEMAATSKYRAKGWLAEPKGTTAPRSTGRGGGQKDSVARARQTWCG